MSFVTEIVNWLSDKDNVTYLINIFTTIVTAASALANFTSHRTTTGKIVNTVALNLNTPKGN